MDFSNLQPLKIVNQQLMDMATNAIALVDNLVGAFIFLILVWILRGIATFSFRRGLTRAKARPALIDAIVTIVSVAIIVFGLLIAATIALPGLTLPHLLAGLGIGSLAIGLAFKDIFENFLAGLLILLREPMRVGDFIECKEVAGQVERITIRDTLIRQPDRTLIIVPNAFIYQNPCRVLTDEPKRSTAIIVGVGYGEDVENCRKVIEAAVLAQSSVDKDSPVRVRVSALNESSVDFRIVWSTGSTPAEVAQSQDAVYSAIKSALDREAIEIPFPQRTITFSGPAPFETTKLSMTGKIV